MELTIESKISALLGNERSKEVVAKHCPGLQDDPRMNMAMNMTLSQIIPFSGGKITPQIIEAIAEDLAKL
ncbi:MAG: hypothetical protein ACLQVJ_00445 [Syntrophobacteraceae bacterium]